MKNKRKFISIWSDKKAVDLFMENLVYLLIVVIFVAILWFSLMRVGSNSGFYEERSSKQIALLIDKALPGMSFEIEAYEMEKIARKNKFEGNFLKIDNNKNIVNVRLIEGKGYDYYFFNNVNVLWDEKNYETGGKKIILKIVEK